MKPLKSILMASALVFCSPFAMAQEAAAPTATTTPPAAAAPTVPAEAPPASALTPDVATTPAAPAAPTTPTTPATPAATTETPAAPSAEAKPEEEVPLESASITVPIPEAEVSCHTSMAEITTLREPIFDGGSAWDLLYTNDGMDAFSDIVPIDEKTMVAGGSYTKDKEDQIYHPLLVKFDERFKKVWEVREDTKEQRTIHRVLKTKDGFTVLGDITDGKAGNGIYIASYDESGKVKGKPAPVYERGGDLDSKAIIPAQDGGGYIVAAQFIDAKDQEKQYGILYKISKAGKVVWKRSIQTGRSTVFNNVQATLDGTYIVTGQVVMSANTSGGWLIRMDDNGAIKWQRTYPRGAAATLQAAAQTKDGSFIVTGKARPVRGTHEGLSAWVMKTDSAGNPLWSRFMKGPYDYEAPDLIVYEDGRATVLLNARGADTEHRSHARLATFSPLGQLQHLEDFTEGQNASAHRLISGVSGERIIAGFAQTGFGDDQEAGDPAPPYTYDGWLLAAPALDLYDDPCAMAKGLSPILP